MNEVHYQVSAEARGRTRALSSHLGIGVVSGVACLDRNPLAVWARLHSGPALVTGSATDLQDAISIWFVKAGRAARGAGPGAFGTVSGFWTLEVTAHALGRLAQRMSGDYAANVLTTLFQAHTNARFIRTADVERGLSDRDARFLLPAGSGAFCISLIQGREPVSGERVMFALRAHTWLPNDMLFDGQAVLDVSPPTSDERDRLGREWLRPSLTRGPEWPETRVAA